MGVKYSITLHPLVTALDIPALDAFWRRTVRDAIREKLQMNPGVFGKPLRRTLKGCRTLRVGDYRVVFQIRSRTIHVVAIIHRSSNYEGIARRL